MLKFFKVAFWIAAVLATPVWSLNLNEGESSLEEQFSQKLKHYFADRMNLSANDFEVHVTNLIIYPEPAQGRAGLRLVEIMGLGASGSQRFDGLFTVSSTLQNANQQISEHQISGMMSVVGPVWVSAGILNRGKIVKESDLALIRLPWRNLASGVALSNKNEIVGRSVKRFVGRGEALFADLLEEAASVNVGDLVELTVQSGPGVMIRSRAVAKQKGRVGDYIRVEQADTRKPLRGLVTGNKEVEVRL
jgi:flagella basal body P-ring formation protein FlgA